MSIDTSHIATFFGHRWDQRDLDRVMQDGSDLQVRLNHYAQNMRFIFPLQMLSEPELLNRIRQLFGAAEGWTSPASDVLLVGTFWQMERCLSPQLSNKETARMVAYVFQRWFVDMFVKLERLMEHLIRLFALERVVVDEPLCFNHNHHMMVQETMLQNSPLSPAFGTHLRPLLARWRAHRNKIAHNQPYTPAECNTVQCILVFEQECREMMGVIARACQIARQHGQCGRVNVANGLSLTDVRATVSRFENLYGIAVAVGGEGALQKGV